MLCAIVPWRDKPLRRPALLLGGQTVTCECALSVLFWTHVATQLPGGLHKGLVGVDRVSGHGQDGAVELLEVVDPLAEGCDGLGVDKVHWVEDEDHIFLALVVLQTNVANLPVDDGVGGEVRSGPGGLGGIIVNLTTANLVKFNIYFFICFFFFLVCFR